MSITFPLRLTLVGQPLRFLVTDHTQRRAYWWCKRENTLFDRPLWDCRWISSIHSLFIHSSFGFSANQSVVFFYNIKSTSVTSRLAILLSHNKSIHQLPDIAKRIVPSRPRLPCLSTTHCTKKRDMPGLKPLVDGSRTKPVCAIHMWSPSVGTLLAVPWSTHRWYHTIHDAFSFIPIQSYR